MAHKLSGEASGYIGAKIGKIMTEGVRRNTRAPVSKSNQRRKVSRKQAIRIAYEMARAKGMGVPAYKGG